MLNARASFVFVDARGINLSNIGQAARSLAEGDGDPLRVIARSGDDLFDRRQIDACAVAIGKSDGAVLILHGGTDSIPGFETLVRAAQGKPLHVHAVGAVDFSEIAEKFGLDFTSEEFRLRHAYLARGGVRNFRNLLCVMGRDQGIGMPDPEPPQDMPTEGIYHPDWKGDLQDIDGYLVWSRTRLGVGEDAPVVGIWFHQTFWLDNDVACIDAIVRALEARGALTIPVFNIRPPDVERRNMSVAQQVDSFFKRDGKSLIDVLVSTMSFSIATQAPKMKWVLPELDVPVLQLIPSYSCREDWLDFETPVSPLDIAMNIAQPEFDGAVVGTVFATRDDAGADPLTGARLKRRQPVAEQIPQLVSWILNWVRLRRVTAAKRKIAIIFHQYPPRADTLGSAIGLDTFASVKLILDRLKEAGHILARDYADGEALAFELLDGLTSDRRYLPPKQMAARAAGRIDKATAEAWHAGRTKRMRGEMDEKWGPCPGITFFYENHLLVGGVVNGNIFIGMQPPRARMEEGDTPTLQPDGKTLHDPYLPATHHYLAYYRWLREDFGAHAVFHIGTHGTLEWMPGKNVGLSRSCYPDAAIADLPHFYPYIVNNPSEGIQAKRRSYACILDHMIPAQTNAGKTEAMEKLEDLLGKAHIAEQEDPAKLPIFLDEIWEETAAAHLDRDLEVTRDEAYADTDAFFGKLHGYLSSVEVSTINDGLHIFGVPPQGERFNETIIHLTRLPSGDAPSLWEALAASAGLNDEDLRERPGDYVPARGRTNGQIQAGLLEQARISLAELDRSGWDDDAIAEVAARRFHGSLRMIESLKDIRDRVRPKLMGVTDELKNAIHGAMGGFVPPGPSGAPTRGNLEILPTGRNFFTIDPFKIPTPEAWKMGVILGDALIERYLKDEGRPPTAMGIILWGIEIMRTGGNDVAEILYLMGMRPVWEKGTLNVKGVEAIPLSELKHPRIDVTVRTGGDVRDALPNVMDLIDDAVCMAASLNEPPEMNPLARNVALDRADLIKAGLSPEEAQRRATFRVFGAKPGTYGAGVADLLESKQWKSVDDLGDIYIHWGGYAYGRGVYGEDRRDEFRKRLGRLDLTVKNEDTREYDMFTSDDFNSFHGGLNAAVRSVSGKHPRSYTADASDPRKLVIRSSAEEARFIFRTRVLNPKWIEGMKRHGYKGAGDLSRTVDFCFQWDATSAILEDWQYQEIAKTYAFDPAMQEFFAKHNPYALQNIAERLLEAIARGLWENPGDDKEKLEALLLEAEGAIEDSLAQGMGKDGGDGRATAE
jgi:cobaltochelatase CobN